MRSGRKQEFQASRLAFLRFGGLCPKDQQQVMSKADGYLSLKNLLKYGMLDFSHGQSISGSFLMRPKIMLFIYKFFQSVYFVLTTDLCHPPSLSTVSPQKPAELINC